GAHPAPRPQPGPRPALPERPGDDVGPGDVPVRPALDGRRARALAPGGRPLPRRPEARPEPVRQGRAPPPGHDTYRRGAAPTSPRGPHSLGGGRDRPQVHLVGRRSAGAALARLAGGRPDPGWRVSLGRLDLGACARIATLAPAWPPAPRPAAPPFRSARCLSAPSSSWPS